MGGFLSTSSVLGLLPNTLNVHHCNYIHMLTPWPQVDRVTPYWVFYMNYTEGGVLTTLHETIEMKPNVIYIIPRGYQISSYAAQPFNHFFIHFSINEKLIPPNYLIQLANTPEYDKIIQECIGCNNSWESSLRRTILCHALLGLILSKMPEGTFRISEYSDSRMAKVCELLSDNFSKSYTNGDLAKKVHLSLNSFMRLFRQETGMTPQQYRRKKSCDYAAKLLYMTSKSIDDIAIEAGFANRYQFSKTFNKQTLKSPAAYRKLFKI